MLYMLDTNVVAAAMRGDSHVDARLMALPNEDWCISAITHSEICYGLALRPDAKRLAKSAAAFFEVATTLPWDETAAEEHGRLRAHLRDAGTPIGDFDEMIAAHALACRAVLVTRNLRYFSRVPDLTVQAWSPEERD